MPRNAKPSTGEKLYSVCIPLFASTVFRVSAASKEQALEKAKEEAGTPCICHHCSREIEVGEIDIDSLNLDCVEEA